jgi:hypothetical protein
MQVLEDRIPVRPGQLVDIGDRRLGIAGAIGRPARQQRGNEIGDRPADRLVDVELGRGIFLLLEVLHADDQTRDAAGLVDAENPFGELDRLFDVTLGNRRDEGAVQQLVVLRIGSQRGTVEGGGGGRIPLDAGMAGGQIAAGRGQRPEVASGGKLRGGVGRVLRRLRRCRARQRQSGEREGSKGPAIATSVKHHGSLLLLES